MNALVTGGGGFLGGAIVRLLKARGDRVLSLTRTKYSWLDEIGVEQPTADLNNFEAVKEAMIGCEIVYHVAAKAGVWGRTQDYINTNVNGTNNIIRACKETGVRKLVYTSTPSVVHNGLDIENGNESLPYPKAFEADYPRSKATAERMVIEANGRDLATVSLRPHLIWGPNDPHLIPRILERGKSGKLRKIGDRKIMVDTTYVANAADAHILAGDRLTFESPIAGKTYFISDGAPVELWEFINKILDHANIAPVNKSISLFKAKVVSRILETFYRLTFMNSEPPLTRFVVSQLSTSHWYDISAAKRDLGYSPSVSIEEGLNRLAASFRK